MSMPVFNLYITEDNRICGDSKYFDGMQRAIHNEALSIPFKHNEDMSVVMTMEALHDLVDAINKSLSNK